MRRRWYWFIRKSGYYKRTAIWGLAVFFLLLFFWAVRGPVFEAGRKIYDSYGVRLAGRIMKQACPALFGAEEDGAAKSWLLRESPLLAALSESQGNAYERLLAESGRNGENGEKSAGGDGALTGEENAAGSEQDAAGDASGQENTAGPGASAGQGSSFAGGTGAQGNPAGQENAAGNQPGAGKEDAGTPENGSQDAAGTDMTAAANAAASPGTIGEKISEKAAEPAFILEKLADYDYLMKNFYSVHPTTTAGRDVMNAEKFLSMDFSIDKEADGPQILIYHTHSQEEFSDFSENPEATIVGVGTYLAGLLEEKGYEVIHDTSVYDLRDGKLDRSQAYTYALDGITGILQKYPSIEVVLDVHRDGVAEGTHLVTEVNGKPTAQIMFFNGMSQTPDGPIEYLPNPNRDANLGFSFQLQLKAAEQFPGFTRRIYLKGLRYNEHVRARAVLIEVGAQTNTYAEAKNAMEPLSEILDAVLGGG